MCEVLNLLAQLFIGGLMGLTLELSCLVTLSGQLTKWKWNSILTLEMGRRKTHTKWFWGRI